MHQSRTKLRVLPLLVIAGMPALADASLPIAWDPSAHAGVEASASAPLEASASTVTAAELMRPAAFDFLGRESSTTWVPTPGTYVPPTFTHESEDPAIPHHPALHDAFSIGVGAFLATSSTEARLDSDIGIGTNVDLEDLLGLDSTSWSPQGLARWRFTERWRLELEYFQLDRSNTASTNQDINWGDETFPAGTELEAEFNIAVTRFSVGYSFFKRPDKEIGIALGFHITDIEVRLGSSGGASERGTVLAPLPVISLYGQFALTDTWALAGRFDAFRVEYEPYKGHIYSLGMDVLWQPFRHFGFGFGWRGLDIEVSAEKNDFNGRIDSTYAGPIAFVSASF